MGLLSFLNVNRPAPTPVTTPATSTPAAKPAAEPVAPVAVQDSFEAGGQEPLVDLGGAAEASFPTDWADLGSGGGGKVGSVEG